MPKRVKSEDALEDKIVENLVKLQKVHTDLAEKFDKLAKEISSLLSLFEVAAKSFSMHPAIKSSEGDREFLNKIDKLLEQNKTIARGLTLLEDQMKSKMYGEPSGQSHEYAQEYAESYNPSIKANHPLPKF